MSKITSQAARKALGEAGFFEKYQAYDQEAGTIATLWYRTQEDMVTLFEHRARVWAEWERKDGKTFKGEVDFSKLGVRNENIQNNNSPDE